MQLERAGWTDERLVRECLDGNQQAWGALLEKYKNLIFSIPVKMGLREEAPDIFQAVCLDLLTDLPKLREPKALAKWLMQASYRKCLRHMKRSERHVELDEEAEGVPSNAEIPEDLLAQLERELSIREVIADLPERCEQLVRMLFYENPPRPYEAVAAELGIATGSVGFIRGRCLSRLKKQLEKKGF